MEIFITYINLKYCFFVYDLLTVLGHGPYEFN